MNWHIALTEPGKDRIAAEALRNRGYLVYRPLAPCRLSCGGNHQHIRWVSMMPGYLPVIDAIGDQWRQLRNTSGIRTHKCLLPGCGGYATLSDTAIARIRHVEQELASVSLDDPRVDFSMGQSVRIADGLIKGIIENLDDREKAVVKIMLLSRPMLVKIRYDELKAVEATG